MTASNEGAAPELGLFVIWSSAREEREQIIEHTRRLLDVRRVCEIHWTRELVPRNCARFYRGSVASPFGAAIQMRGGEHPLLLVTAVDRSPRYELRVTQNGRARVNATFFDASQEFRAWLGGKLHVHASLSATEAERDLMLLLGTDPETHVKENPRGWCGKVEEIHRDLSGARGWSSPTELFHALNHTVRYVVLRNFEGLPQSLHVGSHDDVDLLTDDYGELVGVMNARPHVRCVPPWGGPHWVKISGADMWFDLRFVGDQYYDPKWAREILDRRVWNANGFYAPSYEDYFESLAYHAVVHKQFLSAEYKQRLAEMAGTLGLSGWDVSDLDNPARVKELLAGILRNRGCSYRRPRDVNVFYNFEAAGHHWPRVRRKLAGIFRKALRIGYRVWRRLGVRHWGAGESLRYPGAAG